MSYAMKITSLLLFTFCIAISTEAKSETECEIFYEVYPHKDAAYLIGRGLYDEFNGSSEFPMGKSQTMVKNVVQESFFMEIFK